MDSTHLSTMPSKSNLPVNSATFSGFASVTGLIGTALQPPDFIMEMSYVPILLAMSMISTLSSPMRGRTTGKSRSFCSARMFISVCDATCPRESPMMIPEAPMLWAKRFAVRCMVLLQRTQV